VACEGQTEVDYLRRVAKRLGDSVSIKAVRRHSAPEHVLALAVELRDADRRAARASGDRRDAYDETWIVVDLDRHANLAQTLLDAPARGISAAVSVPCFEVWLVLHLADRRAAYPSAKAAKADWRSLTGQAGADTAKLDGLTALALDRADALCGRHEADGIGRLDRNPSTEVGTLIGRMCAAARIDPAEL
jgi:hypothetical protein